MTARRASPRTGAEEGKYNVRAIGRAISVLNSFSRERPRLSLDEITRETGLSKPTAFRILATLQQYKYVIMDPSDGRYRLGSVFLALGAATMGSTSLRGTAKPHLAALRDALSSTVLMGVLMDDFLVYLDKMESPGPVRIAADIGWRRDPPNFGMLGHVLMAHLYEKDVTRILDQYPLKPYTQKSLTDRGQFMARLRGIREQGFVVEYEEAIEGVFGIAAPIFNSGGEIAAAVGAAFPMSVKDSKRIEDAVDIVLRTASAISADLGHRPGP